WILPVDHATECDLIDRERGNYFEVRLIEHSLLDETIEAQQQRVSGKGREALVRRVGVTSRIQGQDLPNLLTGSMKKIGELISFGTEVSDTVGTGKRRWMQ